MQTTLNFSLNSLQHKQEKPITSESLSQQSLNQEEPGQTCIKCGRSEPEVKFKLRSNTYGKRYPFSRCTECHNAIQRGRDNAARKKWGKAKDAIRDNKPPEGTPCDCCGKPMTHKGKHAMHFDHDWKTETFRGWLCKQCNVGIGQLGDNVEGLMQAVRYLTKDTI